MERTAISTQGKKVTFKVDGSYLTKDDGTVFEGFFSGHKYCVAYTTVKHDRGMKETHLWGSPTIEHYDNGNVGYQNFNYFNDKEEAVRDYNGRSVLSPKLGVVAYADVFLFENKHIMKAYTDIEQSKKLAEILPR
jgi:hypothetical protein